MGGCHQNHHHDDQIIIITIIIINIIIIIIIIILIIIIIGWVGVLKFCHSGDRARDHPRFRRPGPAVRRHGQPGQLVGRRHQGQVPREGQLHHLAVRQLHRHRRQQDPQRRQHAGRDGGDPGGALLQMWRSASPHLDERFSTSGRALLHIWTSASPHLEDGSSRILENSYITYFVGREHC